MVIRRDAGASADSLLPLKPNHFLLLVALSDGDRHGYALKKEVARRTEGRVQLGPGSLYRAVRELADLKLIEESGSRPDPALDDERRRYYRLTELGRRALAAEAERLDGLVRAVRASRLLADESASGERRE